MRLLLSLYLSCLTILLPGQAYSSDGQIASEADAWLALRDGNAVVLMRHAIAPGVGDPAEFDLEDCSTQRNLSEDGRRQSVVIGNILREKGITDATVLSSQWCRCMETARLLDLGEPQPTVMLNSFFQDRSSADKQTRELRASLNEWLFQPQKVKVLVTHQVNISALTGQYTGSGDMLIVTMEKDKPLVLARISTD